MSFLKTKNSPSITLIVILLFTLFSSRTISAQSFSHSLGVGPLAGEEGIGLGTVYSPRINVIEVGSFMTTSIGTHFGLILNTNTDNSGSTNQSFIGIELPLMLEINLGAKSSPENSQAFGGFLGIGYGFSTLSQADPGEAMATGVFYVAGLRFSGDWGIKFSYLENFNPNIFGGASIIFQWNMR
jgi:hypothetical protein